VIVDIPLPWLTPPLSLNDRRNRWSNARLVKDVRASAYILAKSHRLHAGGPWPKITVTLHYAPQVSRVRDSDNLVATEKPLVDGLVDAGVVRDDDTSQVIRNPAVIHPATGQKGRLWLTVQIHDEPQSEVAS
jgi:crossover junction endodeoxyribonuclease RusA